MRTAVEPAAFDEGRGTPGDRAAGRLRAPLELQQDLAVFAVYTVAYGLPLAATGLLARLLLAHAGMPLTLLAGPALALAWLVGVIAVVALVSRLVPRLKEGEYPFPDHPMARAWMVRLLLHRVVFWPPLKSIIFGSPTLRWLCLKAFHADVPYSFMSSSDIDTTDPELLTIEAGAMLGGNALLTGHSIDAQKLVLKRVFVGARTKVFLGTVIAPGVRIGRDASIGADVRVAPDAQIGDHAYLGAGCLIGAEAKIGTYAVIGHRVMVGSKAVIGDFAMIDSGAVVPNNAVIGEGERFPGP